MPQSNKKTKTPDKSKSGSRGDSLDKLREILLGGERRSRVEHTSRVERDLAKQIKAIRAETEKGLASVERALSDKVEALHDALLEDQASRRKNHAALSKRITKLAETMDEKLAVLRKRITKSAGDLRGQLSSDCTDIRAEIDAELADIRHTKTDRATLSGLLTDVA